MTVKVHMAVFRNGEFVDLVIDAEIWPADPACGIEKPYLYSYAFEVDQDIELTPDEEHRLYTCAMQLIFEGYFDE